MYNVTRVTFVNGDSVKLMLIKIACRYFKVSKWFVFN